MINYKLHKPDGYIRRPLPGKLEWLKALRSGNYEQGYSYLKCNNKYCCLGILCEIQKRPETIIANESLFDSETMFLTIVNPAYIALHSCGLLLPCSIIYHNSTIDSLTTANDDGLTFAQIADIIDELWYDEKREEP